MLLILIITTYVVLGIFNLKVYKEEYDEGWAIGLRKFTKFKTVTNGVLMLLGFLPFLFFVCWGILVALEVAAKSLLAGKSSGC